MEFTDGANPTDVLIEDLSTINSTITITGVPPGVTVKIWVDLLIFHTWDSDLDISRIDPDGNIIDLSSDNGNDGDNYFFTVFDDAAADPITVGSAPFSGVYRPEQPLSTLSPGTVNGIWTLRITDDLGGDAGYLDQWILHFKYPNDPATGVAVNPAVAALNEATLAAATKVADIAVADDGGFQNFTLLGDDAAYFEVIGNELFLKAGVVLDFEVKNAYSVQVAVDDPTVGGALDAVSAAFTINVGNLTPETLLGSDGNDVLVGSVDKELIFAFLGNDSLVGGPENDLLVGGKGADQMSGGPGEDIYDFDTKSDTGKTAATRDRILDFEHDIDAIDLRGIDAKAGKGNQAFKFIGKQPFSDSPGELRYFKVNKQGTPNDKTLVEGDTNGDGLANFRIELSKMINLTAPDFYL